MVSAIILEGIVEQRQMVTEMRLHAIAAWGVAYEISQQTNEK